jgi:hypothetical protein
MAKLTLTDINSGYLTTVTQNTNNALIETAIENTLSRDGTTPNTMGANLDMNNYKITNLAAPTVASDPARLADVQAALAGGSANLITNVPSGTIAATNVQAAINEIVSDNAASSGASLVGVDGTTVYGALALNLRKPRKIFSKLFASASAATPLKHVILGDSLAVVKMNHISASLDRRMGGINDSPVNVDGTTGNAGYSSAGFDCYSSGIVTGEIESGAYQYWPTGAPLRLDAGGSCSWIQGGVAPVFSTIKVFYVKEPGAGTINLVVAGVTQATASANAAVDVGVLSFTQTDGQATVSTTVTGASVRILFVHGLHAVSGLDQYGSMSIGGLLLTNATSSAQGRGLWQAALTLIAPDFLTFEFDDDFGTDAPSAAAFVLLVGILDAACPYADKVIIGSTPRAANDSLKLASRNYLQGYCANKNASWLFFDSYYLMGSYAEMNAIFGADDGVHPTAAAQAYAAEVLWTFLGLDGFNLGYVSRALNDTRTISRLAKASTFGNTAATQLKVNAHSANVDWWFNTPRSFAINGLTGEFADAIFRISSNTASVPNVIPLDVDYVSSGNVRKRALNTSSGIEYTEWKKTDNSGGGRMHMLTGLIRNSFTRAELAAFSAASHPGAFAYCSDCTGGAQLAYSNGTSWLAVDGKTAI